MHFIIALLLSLSRFITVKNRIPVLIREPWYQGNNRALSTLNISNEPYDILSLLTQSPYILGFYFSYVTLKGRLANVATLRVSVLGQPGRPFNL